MDMNKPSSIYQVGIGALVVAAVLAYLFVVSPQLANRAESKEVAASTMSAIEVAQGRVATLQAKAEAAADSIDELNEMVAAFPNTYKQDEYIALLSNAARTAGVTIDSISTTTPSDPDGSAEGAAPAPIPATPAAGAQDENAPPEGALTPEGGADGGSIPAEGGDPTAGLFPLAQVEVSMTLSGSSADIQRFLNTLAGLSRPTIVDSLSVSSGADSTATAEVSGRTYLSRPLIIPDSLK